MFWEWEVHITAGIVCHNISDENMVNLSLLMSSQFLILAPAVIEFHIPVVAFQRLNLIAATYWL